MKKLKQWACMVLTIVFATTGAFAESALGKMDVKIQWYGHSSFGISNAKGVQIVTDPYASDMGYTFPKVSTNILTVSHDHFDHSNVKALDKYALLINKVKKATKDDIAVKGVGSYHDDKKGTLRGNNIIYTYKINEVSICHLGDLGVPLAKDQIRAIGKVDILMVPVGGVYTIDGQTAAAVVKQLHPKIVIPMHYKTDVLPAEFGDVNKVDAFTAAMKGWKVEKSDALVLNKAELDQQSEGKIVVMNYGE